MADVVLALGSNLGDSAAILQGALDDLGAIDGLVLDRVSSVFETDPVGGPDQDPYLNAIVVGVTTLDPRSLLAATQAVEQAWHRTREVRWGPRTLDVDIIAMGDVELESEDLTLPHPRAHERGFVLVPWLDADRDATLVGHGAVVDLLADLPLEGVRRTDVPLQVRSAP